MNTKQRFDFDPILEKISHHIPDEEINLLFPFKKFNTQGRSRKFKTSQLYRAHILAMLKGIPSFSEAPRSKLRGIKNQSLIAVVGTLCSGG